MTKIIFIRCTFRLHDNPLLEHYDENTSIVFLIDSDRILPFKKLVPSFDNNDNLEATLALIDKKRYCWGYHQYYLYLLAVRDHYLQLTKMKMNVHLFKGKATSIVELLSKHFDECIYDLFDEPGVFPMDNAIKKKFKKSIPVCTHTMVDWTKNKYVKTTNKKFKENFVKTYYPHLRNHNHVFKTNIISKDTSWKKDKLKSFNINNEISRVHKEFLKNGIEPLVIHEGNIEDYALKLLERSIKKYKMNTSKWYKPNTVADLRFETEDPKGLANTSKLSPFLAIGVLSSVRAFQKWNKDISFATKQGTALDQMLWRELFHASSTLPHFWDNHDKTNNFTISKDSFWKEYSWKNYNAKSKEYLNWIEGKTKKADTDIAMKKLAKDGWIHHLSRHMVADFLTRGGLENDWMLGEAWFKQTLLDHDASVNRCNWLWLSASAFSFKQTFAHYNHSQYVTNHSKKARKLLY
jgi:deoxyribodipyrimidine photolyase